MNDQIIVTYCICADLLKGMRIKDDPQSKMNSAEIMTTAITAAFFFGGSFSFSQLLLRPK